MSDMPILEILERMDQKERERILFEQGMAGYFGHSHPLLFQDDSYFQSQKVRNLYLFDISKHISSEFKAAGLNHAFLKGVSLLESIYPEFGSRFMSDIDVLVLSGQRDQVENLLKKHGWGLVEKKGSFVGNQHKEEYLLNSSVGEVCLEVHYKLFWHLEEGTLPQLEMNSNFELPSLSLEEHLIFLIGHYCHQHTCQKLYWLWDIHLYFQKFSNVLDYEKLISLAQKYRFKRSLYFCLKILKDAFLQEVKLEKEKSFIPIYRNQLYFNDKTSGLYYYLLKHLLKDSFFEAFKYDLFWLLKRD